MNTQCGSLTLAEVVDEFFINNMIDKKKNFVSYMVIAKRAWQKMFLNTFFSTTSAWQTLQNGLPYDYVNIPPGTIRFFTASVQDRHGLIQPLFYNSQINIIPQPTSPTCGCTQCQCDGLCDDLSSTSVTTKLLFTINGVNYYEKDWIKTCQNGDVILWREVPTKKYNDFIGQSGDFNADYNTDFAAGNPGLDNFSIVTQTFQEKICSLEVRPCGCPIASPQNIQTINTCCAGFFPFGWHNHRHKNNSPLADVNSNGYGQVKLSECGTKLYFIPTKRWWEYGCNTDPLIPTYLLLNTQTNGINCTDEIMIPDYPEAIDYIWAGVDARRKQYNSKYSLAEKQAAQYHLNDCENKLIMFLNPLNLQEVANYQDAPIVW